MKEERVLLPLLLTALTPCQKLSVFLGNEFLFSLERQGHVFLLTLQDSSSFTRLYSYVLNVFSKIIMNSVICD